jgi:hypothetical protein
VLYTVEFQCPGTYGCACQPCNALLRVDIIADRLDTARLFRAHAHGGRFRAPSLTALDHHVDFAGPRARISLPGTVPLPAEVLALLNPPSKLAHALSTDAAASDAPSLARAKRPRVHEDAADAADARASSPHLQCLAAFRARIAASPVFSRVFDDAAPLPPPPSLPPSSAALAVLDRATMTLADSPPADFDAGCGDFAFVRAGDVTRDGFACCVAAISLALFKSDAHVLELRCAVVRELVENTKQYLYRYATAACKAALLAAVTPATPLNLVAFAALANALGRPLVLLGAQAATITPMSQRYQATSAPLCLLWNADCSDVSVALAAAGQTVSPPRLPPLFKSSVMRSGFLRSGVAAAAPAPTAREFDSYFASAAYVRDSSPAQHGVLLAFVDGQNIVVDSDAPSGALDLVMRVAGLAQQQEDRSGVLLLGGDAITAWNCGGLSLALATRLLPEALDRISVLIVARSEAATLEQWRECDRVLRRAKNASLPFGGVQCVFFGNFADDSLLSAAVAADVAKELLQLLGGQVALTSLRVGGGGGDGGAVRDGGACVLYGSGALADVPKHDANDRPYLTLVSTAESAESINTSATSLRKPKRFEFHGGTFDDMLVYGSKRRFNYRVWSAPEGELAQLGLRLSDFPCTDGVGDRLLAVWPGCRVLLTASLAANRITNEREVLAGSIGTVVGLVCYENEKQTQEQFDKLSALPLVEFECGTELRRRIVRFRRWTAAVADRAVFVVEQIPLVLAFAVHPAQIFAPVHTDVFVHLGHWPQPQPSAAALTRVVARPAQLCVRRN